ncbi:MAG TPA: leucine zipper domain-containing protein [Solirubrobacterales bacterium]|jgi:hypothetical protein
MAAAEAAGISERSARKWLGRWRAEGEAGLLDRSSAPKRIPHRTPEAVVEAIAALRRLRMTAAEIAEVLGLALSTNRVGKEDSVTVGVLITPRLDGKKDWDTTMAVAEGQFDLTPEQLATYTEVWGSELDLAA